MADGIAPAIDKVGAPEPTAPEAQAGAPTMDTTTSVVPPLTQPAEPAKSEEQKIAAGAGPAVGAPKPVEVMSVPQTPLNNATPAGGTPRPELKIDEEAKETPKKEAPVDMERIQEPPLPTSSTDATKDEAMPDKPVDSVINGASKAESTAGESTTSTTGEKRKLEEPVEEATNGDAEPTEPKKAKVESVNDAEADEVDDLATNGKVGRPKKKTLEKERPVATPLGKTARKTRSQGPVEV